MSEFAAFEPAGPRHARPDGLSIRLAEAEDALAVGEVLARHEGVHVQRILDRVEREIAEAGGRAGAVFVAEVDGQVLGAARVRRVAREPDSSPRAVPAGWYLLGVVVAPEHRRRGIGAALTRARIEWVRQRAPRVYYFVDAANRSSVALHERFGFRELTRAFDFPRSGLEPGRGILFVAELGSAAADSSDC